ncbi:MAG: succinylglutamate desuccinylase/aspartoacylase family protein [Bdellovibrionales bacterium]|nr:succinylglutamate desuccinylase/aspartoacylase family protein [Bdellovibrionales bacterium]
MDDLHREYSAQKIRPIKVEDFSVGRHDFYLPLFQASTSASIQVPFIVVRGRHEGPTLGISAAVHGNELNGILIIQAILENLDPEQLRGSLVCAPVVNVPGYNLGKRYFIDDVDLNSTFPGKKGGKPSQQYAHIFSKTFLPDLDYLIDIHTASQGRLNTMYVRAELESPPARALAMNMNPEIVLNAKGSDRTLRAAARASGTPAITVEAGNPSVIQGKMVFQGELGIRNIMNSLSMLGDGVLAVPRRPVLCSSSEWLRTKNGGLLRAKFQLGDRIKKRQLLAELVSPFGEVLLQYRAPYAGIVIGMAADPVSIPGTRYCHLGRILD